jgi:competence protein ComEA
VRLAAVFLFVLNLNTATLVELEALPGVGPVLARRIVDFREKKGGFRRVEELLVIPGISEKKWKAIRDQVEVIRGQVTKSPN